MLPYARYTKKSAPKIDTPPRIILYSERRIRRYVETKRIGKSVMIGANATFTPSLGPCFRVCEITRARRGPGEIPAYNPRAIPALKKAITLVHASYPFISSWGQPSWGQFFIRWILH